MQPQPTVPGLSATQGPAVRLLHMGRWQWPMVPGGPSTARPKVSGPSSGEHHSISRSSATPADYPAARKAGRIHSPAQCHPNFELPTLPRWGPRLRAGPVDMPGYAPAAQMSTGRHDVALACLKRRGALNNRRELIVIINHKERDVCPPARGFLRPSVCEIRGGGALFFGSQQSEKVLVLKSP